jgi:hypothetical protein
MRQIAEQLVLGKGAIAQRVRFSPIFKSRFQRYIAELTGKQLSRIRDLSAAKHRC